jgi:8-oxo-dGTP pyrophosphatase MutT (NUDIX family)
VYDHAVVEGMRRAVVARFGYRLALALLRVWWVIRRPRSDGVRCILRDRDAFVLVRHSYGDVRWMLPGGRIRRGESALETAAREMTQELGVAATRWRELGYLRARSGYWRTSPTQPYRRHGTYYVTADVDGPALTARAAELLDAGWFTAARLPVGCSDALDVAIANGWLD